ncbi:MAG: Hsp20/alpha crystallin family protein [Desulfovibrio sp.]|jgi:HSP20 family protein|nr:Hsp20/alpha crystallin family protein [Desulfovibrio sp.]
MKAIAITSPNRVWRNGFATPSAVSNIQDFSRFTGLDRLFDVLLDGLSLHNTNMQSRVSGLFRPALDIHREKDKYVINIELAGIDENNITVEIKDNELVVSGEKREEKKTQESESEEQEFGYYTERQYGSFTRTLSMPEDADEDAVSAEHKNGVLTIVLPRREPEKAASRTIAVNKK